MRRDEAGSGGKKHNQRVERRIERASLTCTAEINIFSSVADLRPSPDEVIVEKAWRLIWKVFPRFKARKEAKSAGALEAEHEVGYHLHTRESLAGLLITSKYNIGVVSSLRSSGAGVPRVRQDMKRDARGPW